MSKSVKKILAIPKREFKVGEKVFVDNPESPILDEGIVHAVGSQGSEKEMILIIFPKPRKHTEWCPLETVHKA